MTTYFRDSLIVIKLNYLNRPWMCFTGFASCLFSSLLGSYWVGRTRQRLIGSTTWCPKRTTTNVWGTSSAARAWSPVYLTWVGCMFTNTRTHTNLLRLDHQRTLRCLHFLTLRHVFTKLHLRDTKLLSFGKSQTSIAQHHNHREQTSVWRPVQKQTLKTGVY